MLVLDASATVEVLLGSRRGMQVQDLVSATSDGVYAPHVLDVEVAHALRRLEAAGIWRPEDAQFGLENLLDLPVRRQSHEPLLPRIWELRHNATAYDAAYFALAEALGATLVTADRKMTGVPGVRAAVELV